MATTVVNARDLKPEDWTVNHVYIGRGGWAPGRKRLHRSTLANPYSVREYGREKAIAMYRERIDQEIGHNDPPGWLLGLIRQLRGKILVCHCKPLSCHGDILAVLAQREV